ncbi:baculoviral IAP repeat-containing protein 5.2-B-like isoform X5 [Electrophorus electricus]|uniref:baculoviral IAP repeat-containing protein 5.2-B-like isoform X5 n=1 Tax=Electrophorus electricus TaxID=8005 RepID=UPI0015D05167|nr:baculoviral IAP repeat-containing protein 5.2-B-like isoform X5 [Electrophorus electricus]
MEFVNEDNLKMFFYKNRLATYSGWPFHEDCACTSENMAKAGFIHVPTENSPDVAQCFFCYKELEGWEPQDDPVKPWKISQLKRFSDYRRRGRNFTLKRFATRPLKDLKKLPGPEERLFASVHSLNTNSTLLS